jgi:aminopeptidase N
MSGDDTFMRGLNVYLSRHRFANAAFADPVAAIADVLGDPVHDWVEVWLRSTGFDTLSVGRDGDVPVLSRDGSRPHRLRVNAYDESWHEVGAGMVELDAESEIPRVRRPGGGAQRPSHGPAPAVGGVVRRPGVERPHVVWPVTASRPRIASG